MSEYKYNCVMLIDDNEIDNLINAHVISKHNIAKNIIVQNSAKNALIYLSKININNTNVIIPDVIMLDINMPLMNGFDFLMEFEKFDEMFIRKIKVIMLTSSVDPYDIRKSKEFKSVHFFISKPLSIEHLYTI